MNIVHRNKETSKVNANALLGFSTGGGLHDDDDEEGKHGEFGQRDRYKNRAVKL